MELIITRAGEVRCVYGETIDLHQLGLLKIERASHVEPGPDGCWWADLSPVNGPLLGPFDRRTAAIRAELQWLSAHWFLQV